MHTFVSNHKLLCSEAAAVTDYRGHRQTLFPVRELNVKACALVILIQIYLVEV